MVLQTFEAVWSESQRSRDYACVFVGTVQERQCPGRSAPSISSAVLLEGSLCLNCDSRSSTSFWSCGTLSVNLSRYISRWALRSIDAAGPQTLLFLTTVSGTRPARLIAKDRTPGIGGGGGVPLVCQHSDTAAHSGAQGGSESPEITKPKIRQSTQLRLRAVRRLRTSSRGRWSDVEGLCNIQQRRRSEARMQTTGPSPPLATRGAVLPAHPPQFALSFIL